MKALNKIFQILSVVFGLGAVVLFFVKPYAVIENGTQINAMAAQLAFGSEIKAGTEAFAMARSSKLLFVMLLSVLALILSVLTFISKSKTVKYFAPAVSLVSAIYMLVIALSSPYKFIDLSTLSDVTDVTYSAVVLLITAALFVATVFGVAYLLIFDKLEVLASNGKKLTIPKRIVLFFRDYKSELKKIVWPDFKKVFRNTVIVLIVCLVIGILVWAVDYGLGNLIKLLLSKLG